MNAGRPTVMCVSSMICVGTSHGLVLGFDSSQQLKWCHEGELEQGAVTALGKSEKKSYERKSNRAMFCVYKIGYINVCMHVVLR